MILKSPMLACSLLKPTDIHDNATIFGAMRRLKKWPKLATLKMDGIRAVRCATPMPLLSRKLLPIPNISIQVRGASLPVGYDMELWSPLFTFNEIQSIVMSSEHPDSHKVGFHILDNYEVLSGYETRCRALEYEKHSSHSLLHSFVYPTLCNNASELFLFERQCIEEQGEGICFRTLDSPYKQGRSTLKEEWLIKLARYIYSECAIVGFEEQMLNTNEATIDETGKTKRSHSLAGMEGKHTLGSFWVVNAAGVKFKVGTGIGLTDAKRLEYWNTQDSLIGKTIVVKHKACGQKIAPRSPVCHGFRDTKII